MRLLTKVSTVFGNKLQSANKLESNKISKIVTDDQKRCNIISIPNCDKLLTNNNELTMLTIFLPENMRKQEVEQF